MSEKPLPWVYEEDGALYLAEDYTPEDAADERGYLLSEVTVEEAWFTIRPTTAEELADDDALYDLFGDWQEWQEDPPLQVYDCACAGAEGAHKYLRVKPKRTTPDA